MAEYGRAYLSCGGPTSRLEENLSNIGRKFGFPTEVFATPTGIFVSCVDVDGSSRTTMVRIKDGAMNLGRLCWLEGIFEDVMKGKISMGQANKILHSKAALRPPYTLKQSALASFIFGFALSYPNFRLLVPALVCACITAATWWVAGPGLRNKIPSAIFRDFMGAIVTLVFAAFCQVLMPAPFEAFTIGGLVVLVPGLALTTAISELADQNLVSGTAKLMQAILTLLALGLAYMLFHDLSEALHLTIAPSASTHPLPFVLSALGLLVSVSCFCILFRVPRASLPWASLTGLLGWSIFGFFNSPDYIVIATFAASLCVGLVSLTLSKRFKVPSQIFSVPGIVALLPGMLALTSIRSFATGNQSYGLELGMRVALTAGSIVFGLFTARIPFAFKPQK